jgi:hypothetical protein
MGKAVSPTCRAYAKDVVQTLMAFHVLYIVLIGHRVGTYMHPSVVHRLSSGGVSAAYLFDMHMGTSKNPQQHQTDESFSYPMCTC